MTTNDADRNGAAFGGYRAVADDFTARVLAVPNDRWAAPSPCEGWTARDVVAHVATGHWWLAAAVLGVDAPPVGPDDDIRAAWRAAHAAVLDAIADPAIGTAIVDGPFGRRPAVHIVGGIMTAGTLVHTWDLARAAGIDERLDETAVLRAQQAVEPLGDAIRAGGTFGPAVEPPAGADAQARLLCYLGRSV